MNDNENKTVAKEDYEEPCCPFKLPTSHTFIPVGRVLQKVDSYLSYNDYDNAERTLRYWEKEASAVDDGRGRLAVLNELVGLYRKLGKKDEGLAVCTDALKTAEEIGVIGTVTFATTLINVATAYKAFGNPGDALPLYERAKELYEKYLAADDGRLGGLYNNMALTVMELHDLDRAEALFKKALGIMEKVTGGALECAITYCNLADLYFERFGGEAGEKQISENLETAFGLLDGDGFERNGYYAFVCEKCASTFGYYGYFAYENELKRRAAEIYERS